MRTREIKEQKIREEKAERDNAFVVLQKSECDDFENMRQSQGMRNMNNAAMQMEQPAKKKGFFKRIFTRKQR